MNSLKFTDELGGDDLQTLNIDSFGVPKPVSIYVETFGAEHQDISFIEACVREDCDLTPKGIIQSIELGDVDDNKVSSLGPFGKAGLSREEGAMKAPHRIDTVIDAVREAWKTVPDWRLEQMIVNIIWSAGKMDPFFLEDDDLLKAMGEQPTER
ncbi:MAG: methionine adenosyltransferase domain-containing protein [Clostridia bacterium]|nr:methionine adenosyltransferase domain-containing protein [Clostridia bacterium]